MSLAAFGLYPSTNPDFLWSLVSSLRFKRLSLKERRTRGPVQSCAQEIGAIDGCPIPRFLCVEGSASRNHSNLSHHSPLVIPTGAPEERSGSAVFAE